MGRSLPWWRNIGAVLAAITLAVLTFGPSLDGLICDDEGGLAAAAAPLAGADATADHRAPHDEGEAVCLHGHCHHAAQSLPAPPAGGQSFAGPRSPGFPLERQRVVTADRKFGLIRPPRA